MSDEDRKEVLGEVLLDELKAIRELVQDVPAMKQQLNGMDERLETVETDVKAVKAAVQDIGGELRGVGQTVVEHEEQLGRLRGQAA